MQVRLCIIQLTCNSRINSFMRVSNCSGVSEEMIALRCPPAIRCQSTPFKPGSYSFRSTVDTTLSKTFSRISWLKAELVIKKPACSLQSEQNRPKGRPEHH